MLYYQAIFLLLVAACPSKTHGSSSRGADPDGHGQESTTLSQDETNLVLSIDAGNTSAWKVSEHVHMQAAPTVLSARRSVPVSTDQSQRNYTLDDCEVWDSWEAPKEALAIWPYYRSGYDYDGNVVYVSDFGKLSLTNLAERPSEIREAFWKQYEQSMLRIAYDARHYNDGDGMIMIFDWEGFTMASFASASSLKHSLKLFTSLVYNNRSIKYGFVVNVNFAGDLFIKMAKPFLGNALDKFEVYGTRADQWKPKLLKNIPAKFLPPKYGGERSWKPLPIHVCKK